MAERPLPRYVGIVVPARNEEGTVTECLARLDEAARHRLCHGVFVEVIVVLDSCSDRSEDLVVSFRPKTCMRIAVIDTRAGNVGAARRRGLELALENSGGLDPRQVWLATTDADSRVPSDWLARQLTWRRRGAEAVAGTVRVEAWNDRPFHLARRFANYCWRTGISFGHPHVHGANLSFSRRAYEQVGGMPELSCGEDRALFAAFGRSGVRTVSAGDLPVETSPRRTARAAGGFADFLRSLEHRERGEGVEAAP